MKYIPFFALICIFFQPTAFGMLQKEFKDQKIKNAITQKFSKRTFASMKLPITKNYPKTIKKTSYPDAISIPKQNQNSWLQIISKIKSWLNITPKVVYSEGLTPGSFADLRIKEAAGSNSAMYPKVNNHHQRWWL